MSRLLKDRWELVYPPGTHCPYEIGDQVDNPVIDGDGNWRAYRGVAHVVEKNSCTRNGAHTTVTLKCEQLLNIADYD